MPGSLHNGQFPANRQQTIGEIILKRALLIGAVAESLVEFRAELIKDLIARGYEVTGAGTPPVNPDTLDEISALGAKFVPLPLNRTAVNPLQDIGTLWAIRRLLLDLRPDVMICYTIKPVVYGGLAIRLAGLRNVRFVPMVTGLGFAFHGGSWRRDLLMAFATFLYRQSLVAATSVIFQNPDDRATFVDRDIVPHAKTRLVNGSGVNLSKYARVPLPEGPTVTFLLAARLLKAKGIREYCDAAGIVRRKYPNTRFIIIGHRDSSPDAIDDAMIESWADSTVIDYQGGVRDVRPFVSQATVCVLPSYSEGLPRTILEGLAMGRPVIVTDVPGCRETVEHDVNGCLVPVRDVRALADAMERYLVEPGLAERHGEASYQMALDRFDVRKVNLDIMKEADD